MKATQYHAAPSGKAFVIKYDRVRWWVYHADMLVARRPGPADGVDAAAESARLREAQEHVDRLSAHAA